MYYTRFLCLQSNSFVLIKPAQVLFYDLETANYWSCKNNNINNNINNTSNNNNNINNNNNNNW